MTSPSSCARKAIDGVCVETLGKMRIIEGSLTDLPRLEPAVRAFKSRRGRASGLVRGEWRRSEHARRKRTMSRSPRRLPRSLPTPAPSAFVGAGSQAEYGPYDRAIGEDDATRPTTLYGKAKLAAGRWPPRSPRSAGCASRGCGSSRPTARRMRTTGSSRASSGTLRGGKPMALTAASSAGDFCTRATPRRRFGIALTRRPARGASSISAVPTRRRLRETVMRLRDLVDPTPSSASARSRIGPIRSWSCRRTSRGSPALGWEPQVPLDQGLRETVDWYVATRSTLSRTTFARRIRAHALRMVHARQGLAHRRLPLDGRHPRGALRRRAARRSRPTRLARPRPLHPQQGPRAPRSSTPRWPSAASSRSSGSRPTTADGSPLAGHVTPRRAGRRGLDRLARPRPVRRAAAWRWPGKRDGTP